MGYQTSQEEGNIESSATGTDLYQALITASRMRQATLNVTATSEDASALQSTSTAMMMGLYEYTIDVESLYPTSAPRYGNQGFVTFASGYVPFVRSFTLNFDFGEIPITSRAAADTTALNARLFRPARRPIITGTFSTLVDSATKPTALSAVNAAAASAVFKIAEGGVADPSFTGSIITTARRGPTIGPAGAQVVEYDFQFSGDVTSVAGTTGTPAILPAGVVDGADWDAAGAGLGLDIEFFTVSGTSYVGTGFLRSLTVNVEADAPIRINAVVRGSGVLT